MTTENQVKAARQFIDEAIAACLGDQVPAGAVLTALRIVTIQHETRLRAQLAELQAALGETPKPRAARAPKSNQDVGGLVGAHLEKFSTMSFTAEELAKIVGAPRGAVQKALETSGCVTRIKVGRGWRWQWTGEAAQ